MLTIFFVYILLVGALFFERVLGHVIGNTVLPVLIALSAAGSVMAATFAQARINQEIARQGFFPSAHILSSSKPFKTPLGGLIAHLVPSLLVILLPPQGAVYGFILEVKGYAAQLTTLAVSVGLLLLRRRLDLKRPFRAWTPVVFVPSTLSLALLLAPFFQPSAGKGNCFLVRNVCSWLVWIKVLPRWGGYTYEEEYDELEDGTKVTKLVKVKNKEYEKC